MAKKDKKKASLISHGLVTQNRKARFNYEIDDTIEAGLMLVGSEVKSLRLGKANITEAFVVEKNGELYLTNSYISEYENKGYSGHEERRERKLLLNKKEINDIIGAMSKKGYSVVAMKLYFNDFGKAKVLLGLGKGKKLHDKRQTEKDRDWNKSQHRILKNYNN